MRVWLPIAICLTLTAPLAQAATLRIAAITGTTGSCHALEATASPGEKAYFHHLAVRLGRDVLTCPMANRASAAKALAAGELDLAVLDPETYEIAKTTTRALLTVRPAGRLSRIPVVAVTRKASGSATSLAAFSGKVAVFGGSTDATLTVPQQALADHGAGPQFFSKTDVAANADAAAASLRAGRAHLMVLNAAAWERLCKGERTQETRCGDLDVVWRGRPRATLAYVIRRDMPDELRFRLIGIHIALHLEAKDAFTWASSWVPQGAEFEPTEAEALALNGH